MRGLVLGLMAVGLGVGAAWGQQMAITFDDLPAHGTLPKGETRLEIAESILATLKKEQMPPVYGFINAAGVAKLPNEEAVLKAWRAAGEPLGSHTWSHPDLDKLTVEQFETEIEKNEPMLQKYMDGADWHWFRYPFLHEGETLEKRRAIRAWLTGHGYKVAEVNMDFGDYLWNDPYARCVAKHDEAAIQRLHDTYLATAEQYTGVFRELSQMVYGRDVKYVLLMHIGAFDAKMLPELLAMYRGKGFTFVSLPEAESDTAYKDDPDIAEKSGGAELELMMEKKKLKFPKNGKPEAELQGMCR